MSLKNQLRIRNGLQRHEAWLIEQRESITNGLQGCGSRLGQSGSHGLVVKKCCRQSAVVHTNAALHRNCQVMCWLLHPLVARAPGWRTFILAKMTTPSWCSFSGACVWVVITFCTLANPQSQTESDGKMSRQEIKSEKHMFGPHLLVVRFSLSSHLELNCLVSSCQTQTEHAKFVSLCPFTSPVIASSETWWK